MHKYYSSLRPIGPGTFPKEGMIGFKNYDKRTYIKTIDRMAWGEIYYEKELNDKARFSYDLEQEPATKGDKNEDY